MSESTREDAQAKLIDSLRQEVALLRTTLNTATKRADLLTRGLEPLVALYYSAMPLVEVVLSTEPQPRSLALEHLKRAHELFMQAQLPNCGEIALSDETPIDVWCDGSGTTLDSNAGCGVVIAVPGVPRVELGKYLGKGTNNFAELSAVRVAIVALRMMNVPASRRVRIHTDSEYTIGSLTKGWTAKANGELVATIKDMCRSYPGVVLLHVKGHAGNEGNEAADRLAGAAASSQGDVFSLERALEILRAKRTAQKQARALVEHKVRA